MLMSVCHHLCDGGEMSGCYAMRYKNVTYPDALAFNNHVEARDMAKDSKHAMAWCCEWLEYGSEARPGGSRLSCPS